MNKGFFNWVRPVVCTLLLFFLGASVSLAQGGETLFLETLRLEELLTYGLTESQSIKVLKAELKTTLQKEEQRDLFWDPVITASGNTGCSLTGLRKTTAQIQMENTTELLGGEAKLTLKGEYGGVGYDGPSGDLRITYQVPLLNGKGNIEELESDLRKLNAYINFSNGKNQLVTQVLSAYNALIQAHYNFIIQALQTELASFQLEKAEYLFEQGRSSLSGLAGAEQKMRAESRVYLKVLSFYKESLDQLLDSVDLVVNIEDKLEEEVATLMKAASLLLRSENTVGKLAAQESMGVYDIIKKIILPEWNWALPHLEKEAVKILDNTSGEVILNLSSYRQSELEFEIAKEKYEKARAESRLKLNLGASFGISGGKVETEYVTSTDGNINLMGSYDFTQKGKLEQLNILKESLEVKENQLSFKKATLHREIERGFLAVADKRYSLELDMAARADALKFWEQTLQSRENGLATAEDVLAALIGILEAEKAVAQSDLGLIAEYIQLLHFFEWDWSSN